MNSSKCLGLNVAKSLEDLCKSNGKCAAELQGHLAKQVGAVKMFGKQPVHQHMGDSWCGGS